MPDEDRLGITSQFLQSSQSLPGSSRSNKKAPTFYGVSFEVLRPHLKLVRYEDQLEEFQTQDQWQDRALCSQTDPEAFFPEKGGSTREAKKICQGCEVRSECLDYALANDERFGIWGGLSERERRRIKRGVV